MLGGVSQEIHCWVILAEGSLLALLLQNMKSPRYDLISCRCAVYGWLLYLGGLGVSALWLQSDVWLCTADTITPVLEWSLLSTLISSAIWSQKGPLDLVFWSPACCRLFKQAVPWLRPLTCTTETCLFRKLFVLHILGRCHGSSPASALVLWMNANTFSPPFIWICRTSVSTSGSCCCLALRLKSPFQTCYYLFAFESRRSAFCWRIHSRWPSLADQLRLSFLWVRFVGAPVLLPAAGGFFPELSCMSDLNSWSPDALACVHNLRFQSIV